MKSSVFTGGAEIKQSSKLERSDRKLILRLVIWFKTIGSCENRSSVIPEDVAEHDNFSNYVDRNTGETFSDSQFDIKSDEKNEDNTDVKNRRVVLNENNVKHLNADSKIISEEIRKYCNLYSEVIVHIIIPSDNDLSVYPHLFLLKLLDNHIFDDPKINKQKSKCIPAFLKSDYNNDNSKTTSPDDWDTKMAALFSHYVYYYLDWLEFSHYYASKKITYRLTDTINKEGEKKVSVQILDDNGNPVNTGFFTGNGKNAEKIQFRVVNRLKEIADICNYDTEKTKNKIDEILQYSSSINYYMPMEFFDLYDRFGYWDFVKIDGLKEKAKQWHVSHPGIIFEERYKKKWHLLDFHKKVFIEQDGLYYNTILKHGMGKVDGYGGLLFVQTESADSHVPMKFSYVTKGTDVNSFNDWVLVDILQGLSGFSLQHLHTVNNAKTIDNAIRSQYKNTPLFFCGHSLGGGLASSNAIASKGRHAITFNAAGLNFIGSLTTRGFSIITGNISVLKPSNTTYRVHPIRIEGEAIDEIMKVARILSGGMNERGYGRNPLVLQFQDGFLKDMTDKHGINNFLNESILRQLRIVNKPTNLRAVNGVVKKITLKDISNNEIEFICGEGLGLQGTKIILKEKLGKFIDKIFV